MRRLAAIAACLTAGLVLPAPREAAAKNVDLVTLPARQSVQLTIYNSEDLTLVKETRFVSLKKGANQLQFSWANTLIDPTSVQFRPLEHKEDIVLADTVFPGQKPQHLIWNIDSKFEGQAKVEVTYFTSGLSWQMDYVATIDPAETNMKFRGYVRVFNNSGEEYENAEIRMIVGTINLVEKIADLARRTGIDLGELHGEKGERERGKMKRLVVAGAIADGESSDMRAGEPMSGPRAVIKEGLSEYFLFSVEGKETVPNGWSKRMQAVKADNAKFEIVYRMREYQYGPRPARFFTWRNDAEHGLGDSPLPDGRVRLFRENGRDGLAYLGEQVLRYVPIKAEIEVNTGPDDLVVYKPVSSGVTRSGFSFDSSGGREWVVGWDEQQKWVYEIRNYRDKPIAFELRLQFNGDVEFQSEVKTTGFDFNTVEAKLTVPARKTEKYPATVTSHLGTNLKQNRVRIKEPA